MDEVVGVSQKEICAPVLRRVTQVPPIRESIVRKICEEHFGLDPGRIDQLNSYDDKNYRLAQVTSLSANPYLTAICPDGYVLKITNAEDTLTPGLLEGQNALLNNFKSKGLPVPELVASTNGKDVIRVLVSYATSDNDETAGGVHAVRIMHYIPGQLLCHVPASADIFYKVGQLLARVHNASEAFRHPIFDHPPTSHWSLYHFCHVKDILHAIEDDQRRRMVVEVIDAFKSEVLSQVHSLQAGQIHGDFNEQNILVHQNQHGGYEICGVLDMGDTQRSCLIFDVAIAIVYMTMLDAHGMHFTQVGGHFLGGYFCERKIPAHDARLLRLCMCARYCQSLVLGQYTYMQNPVPENEYVLFTQKKGWPQLIELWQLSDSDLYGSWRSILSTYGIENAF